MENEIKNVSTVNKNLVMIIAFVVLGIVVGYFLGNSKVNTSNQGAQTISSDIKDADKVSQCPTHMVYNPETGQCEPATPEQITWQNWQEIKAMSYVQRGEKIEELMRANSKMVKKVDDFGTVYEIYDPETGLPMKKVLQINPGYVFSNPHLNAEKTATAYDILKQDSRNPSSYSFLREYGCGGSCANNGCCQLLVGGGRYAWCDCDSIGGDNPYDIGNDGCSFS